MAKSTSKKGGNPPKDTRWPPGFCGNKTGRPKGSKNLRTLMMEAAHDPVKATIDGKSRNISKLKATTMPLATKAASGDNAAIAKFLAWIDEIEMRAAAAKPAQFPLSDVDLEVLRATYGRMRQCEPKQLED